MCRHAVDVGNTDGGWSVHLLFKHKSGRVSCGKAVLHKGKVAWWYPGGFDDISHIPESKDEKDPIIKWAECPSPEKIVEAMARRKA